MILSNGTAIAFPPQALGEITPQVSNGYFYRSPGLTLANKFGAYGQLYRKQPAVATLVDKIANAAARLTIRVWDNSPDTGKVQDVASPLAKLIAAPSEVLDPFAFYRWTFATLEVYGEAFWLKVRDARKRVYTLLPMHPSRTVVDRDEQGNVTYKFTLGVASAGIVEAPAADVVPFLRWDPDSLMRGLSRLEPLNSTLLNEDAARRATAGWWKHGAKPSLILTHPNSISQGAQDRLRASFNANYAGVDNMSKAAILEEGMTAQALPMNIEEMQYIESRKLNMQECCMVYDVPPPVVHILDHATFSNITEQMRSMYRDTMAPRLEYFESVVGHHLVGDFGLPSRSVSFALDEVLRGDFETRAKAVEGLIQKGVMKPAEARPLFDLPDAGPVADQLFGDASLVPLGTPAKRVTVTEPVKPAASIPQAIDETDATVSNPEGAQDVVPPVKSHRWWLTELGRCKSVDEATAALRQMHERRIVDFFLRQKIAVRTALRVKAPGVFDPQAWDADLAALLGELGTATAATVGRRVANDLHGKFTPKDIREWLAANALAAAQRINQTTGDEITAALDAAPTADPPVTPDDAVSHVFEGLIAARAAQIAATRLTAVTGKASDVAARGSGAATKTWQVNSARPRPSHAVMDGETVGVDEAFSNGMKWPGDQTGGADEVAGCTCSIVYQRG